MKRIHYLLLSCAFIGGTIPQNAVSNTVVIENASGESIELGIDANDRFLDVLDRIHSYFQQDHFVSEAQQDNGFEENAGIYLNQLQWNLVVSHAGVTARTRSIERDYHAPITSANKEDIAFIVTTLAWANPVKIWNKEDALKSAGARIDAIHPLNFVFVIFDDPKLVAGVEAIKGRMAKIKDEFFSGITNTLKEEAKKKNLLQFVDDFAERLKIKDKSSKKELQKLLEDRKYDSFVDKLLELKPREDADRHNM